MKRLFDIIFALLGLLVTTPLFIIIAVLIITGSRGSIFYKSKRMGQYKKPFYLFKFRTMVPNSDNSSITVGTRDPRITKVGYWLRKYKLDELPQLFNVLKGEMSIVGPRPDVSDYSEYYTQHMPEYFNMKPGITSYASIYFSNESELYVNSSDPEQVYINQTIPEKVELDRPYYNAQNINKDLEIILKTFKKIFKKKNSNE
jgi:lipopolysaccharide/colanic/teichoic acid biosynthesis glycosyltransferase